MLILGLRSSKKRSLLYVNEHFESERNDKVVLLDSFLFMRKKYAYGALLKYMWMLEEGYSIECIHNKFGISSERIKSI